MTWEGSAMIDNTRLPSRFWDKVVPEPNTGCWLWIAAQMGAGYGYYWNGDRLEGSHRVAYRVLVGLISEGLEVDHRCQTPLCVNPNHMELVTKAENRRRVTLRRTHCKRGHLFDAMNTRVRANGKRDCRRCAREAQRRTRA